MEGVAKVVKGDVLTAYSRERTGMVMAVEVDVGIVWKQDLVESALITPPTV